MRWAYLRSIVWNRYLNDTHDSFPMSVDFQKSFSNLGTVPGVINVLENVSHCETNQMKIPLLIL